MVKYGTNPDQPKGLSLKGDLQIDIAENALRRHRADSRALKFIVDLKDVYTNFPDHMRAVPAPTSMSFYIDDADMKSDVVTALHKSLELDNLDEYARIGIEELLSIQESTNEG